MQGSTRAHTHVHTCALSMHTNTYLYTRHPDAVTAPLRARGQDTGHWGGAQHLVSQAGPHPQALVQAWVGSQWEGLPETSVWVRVETDWDSSEL